MGSAAARCVRRAGGLPELQGLVGDPVPQRGLAYAGDQSSSASALFSSRRSRMDVLRISSIRYASSACTGLRSTYAMAVISASPVSRVPE